MLEVGRLCVKTAGRDAMRHCVVIEEVDAQHVLVDGNTRRKKVNKAHLEPLNTVLKIKKGADTKEVLKAFADAELPVIKNAEPKKANEKKGEKPKKAVKEVKKTDSSKKKKE